MIHYTVEVADTHSHHYRVTLTVAQPDAQTMLALPVWIDFMNVALRGVPVNEIAPVAGVLQIDGDWRYDEFALDGGIQQIGLDAAPAEPAASAASASFSPSP